MNAKHEQNAKDFTQAIKTLSERAENLENLECYLSYNFSEWLKKFANTPDKITAELKMFAEMEV
jgi:hypothetical protein